MNSQLNLYERVFVIMALAIPLQAYQIEMAGVGWSIDRIALIFLVVAFPFYVSYRKVKFIPAQIVSAIAMLLLAFGYLFRDPKLVDSSLGENLALIQGYIILGIASYVLVNNSRGLDIMTWLSMGWLLLMLAFSIYTLVQYYVVGATEVRYPFIGNDRLQDDVHKLNLLRDRRLYMPTGTPAALGGIASFLCVLFAGQFFYRATAYRLALIVAAAMITLLTLSRGAVIALLASLTTLVFLYYAKARIKVDRKFVFAIAAAGIVVGSFTYYKSMQETSGGRQSAGRVAIDVDAIKEGRHLELRMSGIKIISEAPMINLVFGYGIGSFDRLAEGAYSFSSFLTLLVEAGLIGSVLFFLAYAIPMRYAWRQMKLGSVEKTRWNILLFCLLLSIFLSQLFYELKGTRELWLLLAFSTGLVHSDYRKIAPCKNRWVRNMQSRKSRKLG